MTSMVLGDLTLESLTPSVGCTPNMTIYSVEEGQLALAKVDFIENNTTQNKCCVRVSYDGYDLGYVRSSKTKVI